MNETILKILRNEHRRLEGIMVQIENSSDIVQKKELHLELEEELIRHMEVEERCIYIHMMEDTHDEEAEDIALRAQEEHQSIKELLSRLNNILIESDEWESTFRKLLHVFHTHIVNEESAVFTEFRQDFTSERLAEIYAEFVMTREQINTD